MAHTQMTVMNSVDGDLVRLPLVFNDNSETSANYDLPTNGVIDPREMFLVVKTIDATETIDVGILSTQAGGDANGFIAAYSIGTQGVYCVANMYTCTAGSSQSYISANYIGALFFGGLAGANSAEQAGIMALKSYIGDGTAKTISYTCTSGSDTFVGALIFKVRYLPYYY